jgi:hypothetical protein
MFERTQLLSVKKVLYIHIVINEMLAPACNFTTQYYLTFGITNVK